MKRIIVDLDETISFKNQGSYEDAKPNLILIHKLIEYKAAGFEIVVNTSRNVRTFSGNLGKINKNTLPIAIEWLNRHEIPYDEIYVGKPWCGDDGFYIDDKAIRPNEFVNLSYHEIKKLLGM